MFDSDIFDEALKGLHGMRGVAPGTCPGCSQKKEDLRPWPPDKQGAPLYCSGCRLKKALALKP